MKISTVLWIYLYHLWYISVGQHIIFINVDIIDKTYEERNILNNWEEESSWISKSLGVLSNDAEGGNRVCGVIFEVKIIPILSFYSKCIFASAYKFTTIYQKVYAIIQKIAFLKFVASVISFRI